jgi:hypothetical protein
VRLGICVDFPKKPVAADSTFDISLTLPNAGDELIFHGVMCQSQNDQRFVNGARDDQMAGATDMAKARRNAAPAVSEVIMDAVSHDPDAGPRRVLEQIHQGLLDQRLITLPAGGAILAFAAPRDCKQLTFGGRGEQDIAQAQATFSEPRLSTSDTPLPRIRPIVRG